MSSNHSLLWMQMTGTITQGPSETSCELTAMEGALCAKGVGRSAVEAKEAAIQNMKYVVARIHECWKHLLQTFKERRKHTPTTLMAGNETQQRHLYQAVGKPGMWKIVSFASTIETSLEADMTPFIFF